MYIDAISSQTSAFGAFKAHALSQRRADSSRLPLASHSLACCNRPSKLTESAAMRCFILRLCAERLAARLSRRFFLAWLGAILLSHVDYIFVVFSNQLRLTVSHGSVPAWYLFDNASDKACSLKLRVTLCKTGAAADCAPESADACALRLYIGHMVHATREEI
ncbi:unnamed protein product [Chondrus crispus]|uniref:Uncharacterized protein n=1 Tax=Chondrus crispus TaxID=2769 RepID=R7QIT4_CHOCR|nr:unnamed protein product [Chondrus crispus]CDF37335.1 unnamed protein product [Chondrus crispus]|eukprot:XP_005717154.1 unnamed protein product [Chondrus crispus]